MVFVRLQWLLQRRRAYPSRRHVPGGPGCEGPGRARPRADVSPITASSEQTTALDPVVGFLVLPEWLGGAGFGGVVFRGVLEYLFDWRADGW